jgi:hypothetical protein
MPSELFALLAIDSNDAGVRILLRCGECGEPSGFHFPNEPLCGRYPLICSCGAESLLDIRRPIPGHELAQELEDNIPWAPILERHLRPKLS